MVWEGVKYDDTVNQLTTRADIKSVMVPEGTDWQIDFYNTKKFVDSTNILGVRSVETKKWDVSASKPTDRNDCIDIDSGWIKRNVRSLKFSETSYNGLIPDQFPDE